MPDVAGLPKLKEGVEQARSWLERSQVRGQQRRLACIMPAVRIQQQIAEVFWHCRQRKRNLPAGH